jgi:cysteinyl-tRNA synthetase
MLLMNGRKMSKSDGNTISPQELLTGNSPHVSKGFSPMVVKFFMLQSHYRSTNDLTNDGLLAAEKGYKRLMEAYHNLMELNSYSTSGTLDGELEQMLEGCFLKMDDDFSTPNALAAMFEIVPKINSLKDGKISLSELSGNTLQKLKEGFHALIFDIFGLLDDTASNSNEGPLDAAMQLIIELRADARSNKDWTTSDKIRDRLADVDILIKDGKEGTEWSIK